MSSERFYSVFGLGLRSAIEVPELTVADHGIPVSVTIEVGSVPRELAECRYRGTIVQIARGEFLFHLPGIARYHVTGGNRIVVEIEPTASALNVRLYLLGGVLGALCHQRGLLPLHAASVEIYGACVAFAGDSGAGKSTLAAWFSRQGRNVLSDDLCVLSFADSGPQAWPGLPRIKLWDEAVTALGFAEADRERAIDGQDKFHMPLTGVAQPGPLPFAALYLLGFAADGVDSSITQLSGGEAVAAVMRNIYCGDYLTWNGDNTARFARSVQLASRVPVYQILRRRGFEVLTEEMHKIEQHVRSLKGHCT